MDVLKENGILGRQQQDLCLARGLNRHLLRSFDLLPVIAGGTGVYGVHGAPIPPGLAESMVETKETRVLADFGWLPDGRISVSKLSEGALSNGIVSVPPA